MLRFSELFKSYSLPFALIFSIMAGGLFGIHFSSYVPYLKPVGDLFLNLLLTAILPLIFFSVSSAIAGAESMRKMGEIFVYMLLVFLFTGFIAAIYALVIVKSFSLQTGFSTQLSLPQNNIRPSFSNKISELVTTADFSFIFSYHNILLLIACSIVYGFIVLYKQDKSKKSLLFLQAGQRIFTKIFSIIMYFAPIGFFCYFSVLAKDIGTELIGKYAQVTVLYYIFSSLYFVVIYTLYAYIAKKMPGVKAFWKHIFLPMITALATCSSAASIPANLTAAKKMNLSESIYKTVIPLGSMIHKDGSTIGGMMKIAFLFGIFHLDFSGLSTLLTAVGVSVLVGTVMGAIPSGGMLGELLILSVYGFPPSALMMIAAISIIIDPLATLLNVTGNISCCMLIENKMK